MVRGGTYTFTLGKDVTLNTMRAACRSMSSETVIVEPLDRCEPGLNVVKVGDFEPKLPAHVSLRFSPVRQSFYKCRFEVNREEFFRMCRGFPRKDWPARNNTWKEESADDAVYKSGDRVFVSIRYSECVPGEWILDMMDAFAKEFDADKIVRFVRTNKAWLRRINRD